MNTLTINPALYLAVTGSVNGLANTLGEGTPGRITTVDASGCIDAPEFIATGSIHTIAPGGITAGEHLYR